jgi:hypothetical protein
MIRVPLNAAPPLLVMVIVAEPAAATALNCTPGVVFVPPIKNTPTTELVAISLFVRVNTDVEPDAVVRDGVVITPEFLFSVAV